MEPAKLAIVIHDLNAWGGQDRSTLEIARRLSRRWPVEVWAFTLEDREKGAEWGSLRFHPVRPSIRRPMLLKATVFYLATLIPLLRLRKKGRALVHATGACSLASDIVQVQFVQASWKKKQRELMRLPGYAGQAPGFAGWLRRAYQSALLSYNTWIEHLVYTKDKTYIAISESVRRELEESFGIRRNVHVVHHGIDPEAFRPARGEELAARERLRASLGVGAGEAAVLFVGSYERKGLGASIRAVARLSPETRARVRLVAVGGGNEREFRGQARSLGIEDRVIFVGHTQDIVPYYRMADAFLLPTHYEPFGLVIIEAMACGLASVVSRLAGGAELIRDRESGLLIDDPTNADEIGAHLELLVSDERIRKKMGEAARAAVQGRTWDVVAGEYARVIGRLLGDPSK